MDLVASDAASEVAKKDSGFEDSDKKKAPEIDQSLKGVEDVILTLSSHKDSQAPYLGSKVRRTEPCLCPFFLVDVLIVSISGPAFNHWQNFFFVVSNCLYLSRWWTIVDSSASRFVCGRQYQDVVRGPYLAPQYASGTDAS